MNKHTFEHKFKIGDRVQKAESKGEVYGIEYYVTPVLSEIRYLVVYDNNNNTLMEHESELEEA